MARDIDQGFEHLSAHVEELMTSMMRRGASYRRTWTPRVDVFETPEKFIVIADLSGVSPGAVTVEVSEDEITIAGSRGHPVEPSEARAHALQLEIPYGNFERRLRLPARVNAEGSNASFVNGRLVIEFPKIAPTRSRVVVK